MTKVYFIWIICSAITMLTITVLDLIEVTYCKSFSIYRIFTMNSAVCRNISHANSFLEKILISIVINMGSRVFHNVIKYRKDNLIEG